MDLADPGLNRVGFIEKRPGLPKLRAVQCEIEHLQSLECGIFAHCQTRTLKYPSETLYISCRRV